MSGDAKRPGIAAPVVSDQQPGAVTDGWDSTPRSLNLDGSYVAMLEDEKPTLRRSDLPAALKRWTGPEDCARELLEAFGRSWCLVMSVDMTERIRRGEGR